MMKNSWLMEMLFVVVVCIKASVLLSTQTTRRKMELTHINNINSINNSNNINNNSSGTASGEHCIKSTISNKSINNNSNNSNRIVDKNIINDLNNKIINVTKCKHRIRTKKTTEKTRSKTHSSSKINDHHSDNVVVTSAGDTTNKNAGDKAAVAATRATASPRKRSLDDSRQDLDSFNNNNNNYKNNDDYYGRASVEAIDDSNDQEADYNGDTDYKMLTKGDTLYILPNTSIRLECRFKTAAWYNFNFWDNPIVWYKTQHGQETRINMMGNIDHPFNKDRRMNVDYLVYNNYRSFSSHRFLLILPDVRPQDSGQYTCRVYAPENVQLMNVTHHLFVETPPEIILLTNESPNSFDLANQSRERLVQMLNQNLEFDHSSPSVIGCFVLGKSNCPRIKLSFGDHEVLSNLTFSQSVIKVDGEKGMLLFTYATWAVLENYQPMKGHDGTHVTCSVHSRDGPYTSVSAILHIRYRPEVNCSTTSPYLLIVTSPNHSSSSSSSSSPSSDNSYELRVTCTIKSHPPLTSLMWKINDVMTLAGNDAIGHAASRLKESSDGRSLVAWIHLSEEGKLSVNRIVLQAVNRVGTTRIVLTSNRPTTATPKSPHSTSSSTSSPPTSSSSSSTTKRLLPPSASSSSSSFSSLKSSFIPGQMKRTIKRKPLRFTGCATCSVVFSRSCFPVEAFVVLVVWRFPT